MKKIIKISLALGTSLVLSGAIHASSYQSSSHQYRSYSTFADRHANRVERRQDRRLRRQDRRTIRREDRRFNFTGNEEHLDHEADSVRRDDERLEQRREAFRHPNGPTV